MMNSKAFILGLYMVALFIILRHWYSEKGNKGMPPPSTITAPSYLYGVLGIVSNITGDFGTVLAAGLTLGLYYAVKKNNGTLTGVTAATAPKVAPGHSVTAKTPPPKKVKK